MSVLESNYDELDRRLAAFDVLQAIDDAKIPDTTPYEINSTYRHIIRSRGGINGNYFIDTTRTENPNFDTPLERECTEQTFGIISEEGEIEAVKYVHDGKFPVIMINRKVFDSIDTDDISIFDLTDFDEIAGVIYGLDGGYILPEDIQDDPYQMPLMQSAIKWVLDKKAMSGVEVKYRHYLIEKMGRLITVDITNQPNGSKLRQINISNEIGRIMPELSVVSDHESGETFIQSPVEIEQVKKSRSVVKVLLGDSVLFH